MNLYKTGDILLCTGDSALSKAIISTKGKQGKYSHTAQIIVLNGIICVFDAQKEGSFPRKLEVWQSEFQYKYDLFRPPFPIDDKEYSKICISYFGIDYDYIHLAVGFWRKILFNQKVKEKYGNNSKFVCSELTMKILKHIDKEKLLPNYTAFDFTPDDVGSFLKVNNFHPVLSNY